MLEESNFYSKLDINKIFRQSLSVNGNKWAL